MSNFNCIATYYRSPAVCDSLVLRLHHSGERVLCVAKGSILEFYRLESEELVLFDELQVYSHIYSLKSLSLSSGLDSLVVLTKSHRLWHMFSQQGALKRIPIDISVKSRKDCDKFVIAVNSNETLLCTSDYESYLRVLRINSGKISTSDSFFVDYDPRIHLVDMAFATRTDKLVCLFAGPTNLKSKVVFFEILTAEKHFNIEYTHEFQENPGKIIQSHADVLAIFLENSCRTFTTSFAEYTTIEAYFGTVSAVCEIDITRWIICNDIGSYYIVLLGPTLDTKLIGRSCVASSISYIDMNTFFFGSNNQHSKLVRLLSEPVLDSNFQELHDIVGLTPIYDLNLQKNDLGVLDFLAGAGTGLGGGLYTLTKAVSVYTESQMELASATGIWALAVNSEFHTHIVISFYNQTRALACVDSTIKSVGPPGLVTTEATVLVCMHKENIVQATTSCINYMSNQWELVFNYPVNRENPEFKILLCCVLGDMICAVVKSDVLITMKIDGGISKVWEMKCEWEISCIAGFGELFAIGYWVDNSISLVQKASGQSVFKDYLGFPVAAGSAKFVQFGNSVFLMLGLKDGHLVYYEMNTFKKTIINVGCQALTLQEFRYKNKEFILAASDKTILLHYERNKVAVSNLIHDKILFASGFHTENFNDCLAIVSGKTFSVISFEDLQKYSINYYKKEMTILSIIHLPDFIITISLDIGEKYYLNLLSLNYEDLNVISFDINKKCSCVHFANNKVYAGINHYDNPSQDEAGFINIYQILNSKFHLVNEVRMGYCLYQILSLGKDIIVPQKNLLIYFRASDNSLEHLDIHMCSSRIRNADSLESCAVLADYNSTVQVLRFVEERFQVVYHYSRLNSVRNVKMISENVVAVSDSDGNIILLEGLGTIFTPTSGFNLEYPKINCMITCKLQPDSQEDNRNCLIFGTYRGDIGVVIQITEHEYKIMRTLQRIIVREIDSNEKYIDEINRPRARGIPMKINEFVNGDIIEKYFEMSIEQQRGFAEQISRELAADLSEEHISNIVFNVSKLY